MSRSHPRLAGALCTVVALALPATASAAKSHPYTSKLMSAPLTTGNGYPGTGGTALLAGWLKTDAFGEGAMIDRVKITGPAQDGVIPFKGTETDLYATGAVRSIFTGTDTINADGSQSVVVDGTFTGGTARFKGAKGTFRFTGKVASGSTILIGGSKGRIVF